MTKRKIDITIFMLNFNRRKKDYSHFYLDVKWLELLVRKIHYIYMCTISQGKEEKKS